MKATVQEKIWRVKTEIDKIDSRYEAGEYRDKEAVYFAVKAELREMLQNLFMIEKAAA